MIQEELLRVGEIAGLIVGNTQSAERSLMISQFKNGEIRWLVNCGVLTTGFDHPGIDVVAIARATESCGLLAQMAGRGLRRAKDKRDCLILDYGENILRLGYLDELDPERPRRKTNGEPNEPPLKVCGGCDMFVHTAVRVCSFCGFEFPVPELHHEPVSHDMGVFAPPPQIDDYTELELLYSIHVKYGAQPGHPKSCRVEYWAGIQLVATEWICCEHEGPAYKSAWNWFKKRSHGVMPTHAADLVQLGRDGKLAEPRKIRVRSFGPGSKKHPEILEVELGPIPWADGGKPSDPF
jgi:DNA repair protein RadD